MTNENEPRLTPNGIYNVAQKLMEVALTGSEEAQKMINTPQGAKSLGNNLAIAYRTLCKKLAENDIE